LNLDDPSPSLRPHYQASPLLRDGPPLCPATGTQPLAAHHRLRALPLAPGTHPGSVSRRQVPAFHARARTKLAPPTCRAPPGR
jgi:hypothetical protein